MANMAVPPEILMLKKIPWYPVSLLLVPQRALAYRGPKHLYMYHLTEP